MNKKLQKTVSISWRSSIGLNGVNFLLAEVVAVIGPFLSTFLKKHDWDYESIGLIVALGGLGTFLMQIPAGIISDRVECRRRLPGGICLAIGASLALLPLATDSVTGMGMLQSLFAAPPMPSWCRCWLRWRCRWPGIKPSTG